MEKDIAEFWSDTFDEVDSLTVDCKEVSNVEKNWYCNVKQLSFNGLGDVRFNCLMVTPKSEHGKSKRAVIFIPGGYAGWRPRPYLWFEGMVGLFVDPRGQGHSKEDCDIRDNLTTGIQSKYKHHLRYVYSDVRQATNYLVKCGFESVGISGTCFGGSVALGMASLDSRIDSVAAEIPYLADWQNCVEQGIEAYEYVIKYLKKYLLM